MDLYGIAEIAEVPHGMRPYFVDTARLIMAMPDYDPNVLPILIFLTHCCEIYAPPDEMAKCLVKFYHSRMNYQKGPGGLRIPVMCCLNEVQNNDLQATFLAETLVMFVHNHPEMVQRT